ncbi:tetratricopeptide repeat protein [Roseobacter ponti]|uniref:Uncharacterized protein n=1 Tax=Roseobacter ponti TaxID=1891787 RepID=A0A858SYM5_9RHOB|nr:hypothetical protein [Roseobacter ponti]QJF52972.1 hypothetical protein G3256_18215 [Roseobacter ponti]
MTQNAGETIISLRNHGDGFDVSSTFDIIPRTRLVGISSTQTDLSLILSCDCDVRGYREQAGYLIFDIYDGPEVATGIAGRDKTRETVSVSSPRSVSQFGFGELLWAETFSQPGPGSDDAQPITEPGAIELSPPALSAPEQIALNQTRETLLRGISDAIARKILDARSPESPVTDILADDTSEPDIFDSSEERDPPKVTRLGNLRVTSSNDQPNAGLGPEQFLSDMQCPEPDKTDLNAWGTPGDLFVQLSTVRVGLYQDNGRLDLTQALILARLYAYMGFGAEAKSILRLAPELENSHPELYDIADILDFGHARNPRVLHLFAGCGPSTALWSALSAEYPTGTQNIVPDRILEALFDLPDHLKPLIAPEISERLLSIDEEQAAATALRHMEQLNHGPDNLAPLVSAKVAASMGGSDEAEDLLRQAVADNNAQSPQAVSDLVNKLISDDQPVPDELAGLLEAYVFETRGLDISASVEASHALRLAHSGQFGEAFQIVKTSSALTAYPERQNLTDQMFTELAEKGNELTFLEYFFSDYPDDGDNVRLSTQLSVGRRLLEAGFPSITMQVITGNPDSLRTTGQRLLYAEALLDTGEPAKALSLLKEMTENEALALTARAQIALEQFGGAAKTYVELGDQGSASQAAFMSPDWRELTDEETPLFGPVAQASGEDVAPVETRPEMLREISGAIDSSENARATLNALLSDLNISE